MASISSCSVASLSLANCKWKVSCSVFPPAVSAATVIRLRSFGDSCGRFHLTEQHIVGESHESGDEVAEGLLRAGWPGRRRGACHLVISFRYLSQRATSCRLATLASGPVMGPT